MKKNKVLTSSGLYFLFASAFLLLVLAGCKENEKDVPKPKTITDVILENKDFTILTEIIKAAGMTDALRSQELTLFAPNDAAFRSSNITNASAITSQTKDSVMSFVKYHLLGKRVEYKEIEKGKLTMLNGNSVTVSKINSDSTVMIQRAYIPLKNVNADNGIIHVVDRTFNVK